VALPSGFSSAVKTIDVAGRRRPEAAAPLSVTVTLASELDLCRGDLLAHPGNRPLVGQDIEAMLCWMDGRPLEPGRRYVLRHTANEAVGVVKEVSYKLDVNTLSRLPADGPVGLNDFARVKLRSSRPLCHDPYRRNRATGSFVLIDEASCATAAAGIIL
jgi:sulfate adenylyltransferase subunit 1 (EFTu-like GTPase family)